LSRDELFVPAPTLQLLDLDHQGKINVSEDPPKGLGLALHIRRISLTGWERPWVHVLVRRLDHDHRSFTFAALLDETS
jgi:hypothetical protein